MKEAVESEKKKKGAIHRISPLPSRNLFVLILTVSYQHAHQTAHFLSLPLSFHTDLGYSKQPADIDPRPSPRQPRPRLTAAVRAPRFQCSRCLRRITRDRLPLMDEPWEGEKLNIFPPPHPPPPHSGRCQSRCKKRDAIRCHFESCHLRNYTSPDVRNRKAGVSAAANSQKGSIHFQSPAQSPRVISL